MESKNKNYILKRIKELAQSVLPRNAELLLYGSRARGDNKQDSDWDMLIILDKQNATHDDYDRYAYPLFELGVELKEFFSLIVYGKGQWERMRFSPFSQNVTKDNISLMTD